MDRLNQPSLHMTPHLMPECEKLFLLRMHTHVTSQRTSPRVGVPSGVIREMRFMSFTCSSSSSSMACASALRPRLLAAGPALTAMHRQLPGATLLPSPADAGVHPEPLALSLLLPPPTKASCPLRAESLLLLPQPLQRPLAALPVWARLHAARLEVRSRNCGLLNAQRCCCCGANAASGAAHPCRRLVDVLRGALLQVLRKPAGGDQAKPQLAKFRQVCPAHRRLMSCNATMQPPRLHASMCDCLANRHVSQVPVIRRTAVRMILTVRTHAAPAAAGVRSMTHICSSACSGTGESLVSLVSTFSLAVFGQKAQ